MMNDSTKSWIAAYNKIQDQQIVATDKQQVVGY
jgi:hypothetical protein